MSRPGTSLPYGAQRGAYAALHAWGRHLPVTVVDLGGAQRHLTTVVRLPVAIAARIVDVVRRLPGADEHYVYPPTDLHLTVLNLDHLDGSELASHISRISELLAETSSFEVELRGLGLSPQSVFVQVFDNSGALARLRKRLGQLTAARPAYALRHLGFVNVLRYKNHDVLRLRSSVAAARGVAFGALRVKSVEIVRTDRVLSVSGTTLLSSCRLRDDREPSA